MEGEVKKTEGIFGKYQNIIFYVITGIFLSGGIYAEFRYFGDKIDEGKEERKNMRKEIYDLRKRVAELERIEAYEDGYEQALKDIEE